MKKFIHLFVFFLDRLDYILWWDIESYIIMVIGHHIFRVQIVLINSDGCIVVFY